MSTLKLAVVGGSGRMGRELIKAIALDPATSLCGVLVAPGSAVVGQDAASLVGFDPFGLTVSDDPATAFQSADGFIDFTTPQVSTDLCEVAARHGLFQVVGTTGFDAAQDAVFQKAAQQTAIVKSGNMSLGVNLLANLVRLAANALPAEAFDVEILEMHHKHKVDAPSGTALLLGEAAAAGRDITLADASVRVRDGQTGPRPQGSIGFASLRGGSVIGDHSVILAGPNERIELNHLAQDRSIYGGGAVAAAKWAKGRSPGLYAMADVLGLTNCD